MPAFRTHDTLTAIATIAAVAAVTAVLAATQTGDAESCPSPRPWSVELLFAPCVANASYRAAAVDGHPVRHERLAPLPAPRIPDDAGDPAVAERRAPLDLGSTGSIPR